MHKSGDDGSVIRVRVCDGAWWHRYVFGVALGSLTDSHVSCLTLLSIRPCVFWGVRSIWIRRARLVSWWDNLDAFVSLNSVISYLLWGIETV